MITRRMMAGFAVLGIPSAVNAQQASSLLPNCATSGKVGSALWSTEASFEADRPEFAYSAVEELAFNYPRAPQYTVIWRAKVESPSDRVSLSARFTKAPERTEIYTDFDDEEGVEYQAKRQVRTTSITQHTLALGGRVLLGDASEDFVLPSAGPAAALRAAVLAGRPIDAELTMSDGQVLKGALAFSNLAEALALARQAYQAMPSRLAAKQCSVASGSSCYLTTATVNAVGLPDDCWELRALRKFRDNVLARTVRGMRLVDHYYAIAPEIVSRIGQRPDAHSIWLRTYVVSVLPCAMAAELGLYGLAERLYTARSLRLLSLCRKL